MHDAHDGWIPLARAAHRLGLPWRQAYDRALAGDLEAKQTDRGRWIVSESSVAAAENHLAGHEVKVLR